MPNSAMVLFVVVLGTLMVAVDTTIVVLALPTIGEELHSDLSSTIWTLLVYLLVTTILSTQLGRLGDIFGRARIYNSGFGIFTLGSALCGASPTTSLLVLFRGIQAIGGAMMVSNSGAIISDNFSPAERGKAFGYTAMGWNAGATLGIVLGGLLTTLLGWRYIFYINVPIGIAAIFIGFRSIRDVKVRRAKLDLAGVTILGILLVLITYGSIQIASYGVSFVNALEVTQGIALLPLFLFLEKRAQSPLINLSIFKNRVLGYSLFATFLQSTGYLSVAFILIMYLQGIRGFSPLYASLLLVPGYVLASFVGPFMGRLSDKRGSRLIATLGIVFMLCAIGVYFTLNADSPIYMVLIGSTLSGIGSSMFYPANNSAIMANSPEESYGSISGLSRTLGNLGTLTSYVLAITVSSLSVPRYVAFQVFLGTVNLIGGLAQTFLQGIHTALIVSIVILCVALVLSAARGKEVRGVKIEKVSATTQIDS
jgi:EmrB/QacA subfamily drug resistance transporter